MTEIPCRVLAPIMLPLANKFYRQHRSRMRASGDEAIWVAGAPASATEPCAASAAEIIAALRLKPVEQGHWLLGLFVSPHWRGGGVGSALVAQATAGLSGPVWLFCHPDLIPFYQRLGFRPGSPLPPSLASRLARYQRTQQLQALVAYQTLSAIQENPGE